MRKRILVASLMGLGVIAGLTACSGDEGQSGEEVTITTVAPVAEPQQPMQADKPAAATTEQHTTADGVAVPAQADTVTESTTVTETQTTTTTEPTQSVQDQQNAPAPSVNGDANGQTTSPATNGNGYGVESGATSDTTTSGVIGDQSSRATTPSVQTGPATSRPDTAKTLAENSATDSSMNGNGTVNEAVEPPTNAKNLESPVNNQPAPANDHLDEHNGSNG